MTMNTTNTLRSQVFRKPSIITSHFQFKPLSQSQLPRLPIILPPIRSSNSNGQGSNDGGSPQPPTPSPPPITPLSAVEIRFRRGSRKRQRQQQQKNSATELPNTTMTRTPAPKSWEEMTLSEKALELYLGEKGLLFWLNKFAYASIFIIIGAWILFRFVGPSLNLYQLDSPTLPPDAMFKGSSYPEKSKL